MARPADPTTKRVWALPYLPQRPADSHKGDYGRVLVWAGSPGMAGAAWLASKGALRAGAGAVRCACPEAVWPALSARFACVMTAPLPAGEGAQVRLKALLAEADVLCVGPGLGRAPEVSRLVRAVMAESRIPAVVDADALHAIGGEAKTLAALKGRAVLTPHPGELARMTGATAEAVQADRRAAAKPFAERHGVVVALKGMATIVTDGHRLAVNETGNPGMATAGAGDVLAGVIAGLMAQGMAPFEAAHLGVHLHGLAGDLAAREKGLHGLIATDILEALPAAFLKRARG